VIISYLSCIRPVHEFDQNAYYIRQLFFIVRA